VVAKKALNMERTQPRQWNVSLLEPLSEVFGDQNVVTNPGERVSAPVQIQRERGENYAKVVGRHSAANDIAFEKLLDHGETRNAQRFQHSATLPPAPNLGQMQTKNRSNLNVTLA
jgi:hypothetical protein